MGIIPRFLVFTLYRRWILSIEKITVRDIVEDCGVNRNTFYYYFSDIYGLLEEMLISETTAAIEKARLAESPAEGCIAIVARIKENRDAFRNIYSAIGRDSVEYAMAKALDGVLEAYVRRTATQMELSVSDLDVVLIAGVCRNTFFGILSEWIKRNMRDDPQAYLRRIEFLFEESVKNALKRGAAHPMPSSYDGTIL